MKKKAKKAPKQEPVLGHSVAPAAPSPDMDDYKIKEAHADFVRVGKHKQDPKLMAAIKKMHAKAGEEIGAMDPEDDSVESLEDLKSIKEKKIKKEHPEHFKEH
jgi:hypothetical protein